MRGASEGEHPMRALGIVIATFALVACANNPSPPARTPSSQVQTTSGTTSAAERESVGGPGYSGSTEYGLTNGPDGNPYRGNVDPGNPASNREKRPTDVTKSSNAQ